jgi:hypothetical protein
MSTENETIMNAMPASDSDGQIMVFTGNANPQLARDVVRHLRVNLGEANIGSFSDGEVQVEILENVRGRDVFILQSTCAPTNDNLMELLAAFLGTTYYGGGALFWLRTAGPPATLGACADHGQGGCPDDW